MKDFKAEIQKLQAEQAAMETLQADYPADLRQPDLLVWHHSKLCEFGVIYKVKTLAEAIDLITTIWNHRSIDILPLRLLKGTFTSFVTPYHDHDKGTLKPVFPVTVAVSKWGVKFEFYAMMGDHLLSIDVEFEYGASTYNTARVEWRTRTSYGEKVVEDVRIVYPAFRYDGQYTKFIKWASGDHDTPNSFTLYWEDATSLSGIFADGILGGEG